MEIKEIKYNLNYYQIKSLDKLNEICKSNNLSISFLANYNGMKVLEEGDVIQFPNLSAICHVVKPTETLQKIARMYKVSEDYIKENNKIKNIFIGQKLFI